MTRVWDADTGDDFHGAMKRYLLANNGTVNAGITIDKVLSRIRIITKVQHVSIARAAALPLRAMRSFQWRRVCLAGCSTRSRPGGSTVGVPIHGLLCAANSG